MPVILSPIFYLFIFLLECEELIILEDYLIFLNVSILNTFLSYSYY
jgi:hypothetical protein